LNGTNDQALNAFASAAAERAPAVAASPGVIGRAILP
jgi:hypothetical protein